jgi:hypothetical protein
MTDTQESPQPERNAEALAGLLKDVRLQPLLVFAGALALGFLFSRVIRTPDPRGLPADQP